MKRRKIWKGKLFKGGNSWKARPYNTEFFHPELLAAAESPLIVLANHHQFFRIAVLWGGLLK
jgi:hypothetical protein